MRWLSSFRYGPVGQWIVAPSLPVAPWRAPVRTAGVHGLTATGVPGAHVQRTTRQLVLPLRFHESEWPAVAALIEWGQSKASFHWTPDIGDPEGEEVEVYLDAPRVGEALAPRPDDTYLRVLWIDLVVRRVDGAAWELEYYDRTDQPPPVLALLKTGSGLLGRHEHDDAGFPFDLDDWTESNNGRLTKVNVTAAGLRLSANALSSPLTGIQYNPAGVRSRALVQAVLQAETALAGADNLQIGIMVHGQLPALEGPDIARKAFSIQRPPFGDEQSHQAGTSAVTIPTRSHGFDYALTFFADGANLRGVLGGGDTVIRDTVTPLTEGAIGLIFLLGANNPKVWICRKFYAMTDRYVTVSGLPAGSYAELYRADDSLWASEEAVNGVATVDLFPDTGHLQFYGHKPVRLAVFDADDVPLQNSPLTPSGGIWGGDTFAYGPVS